MRWRCGVRRCAAPIDIRMFEKQERPTMSTVAPPPLDRSFAALRRFARPRAPVERCELCSAALAHEHPHLLELATRQIVCACDACSTLFDGMKAGKYRRVSRRTWLLSDFQIA